MTEPSKRDRVLSAVGGGTPDRVPVSFWGHDFLREWSAEDLAAVMTESVRTYDYDYLKINPRATYFSEAWGCTYKRPVEQRQPEPEHWVLREAADLPGVRPVDPKAGPFGEQLEVIRLIRRDLGNDVPIVQTVFSPLSVVGRMANDNLDSVRRWMADEAAGLHRALGAVSETLAAYSAACLEAGADGIFFATTLWATSDVLNAEEYETFGRRYDLDVLEAVQGLPFNVLHVCRPHNMLPALLDYPAPVINWAMHAPGNLSLADVAVKTDKALMGGVDERHALLRGSPDDVSAQVEEALGQTEGRRFLLGPGCSIPPQTPPENLRAAVAAARAA